MKMDVLRCKTVDGVLKELAMFLLVSKRPVVLGKPNGVIQPRVQAVGPERFGIVAIDCAKARSKFMLCDFYGRVLLEPTVAEHDNASLQLATLKVKDACQRHGIKDHIVAVEMTGTYHRPPQRSLDTVAISSASGPS